MEKYCMAARSPKIFMACGMSMRRGHAPAAELSQIWPRLLTPACVSRINASPKFGFGLCSACKQENWLVKTILKNRRQLDF
jgi:hypothetical protein